MNRSFMSARYLRATAQGQLQRTAARCLLRRRCRIVTRNTIVSFTFDDFPRSALLNGGHILKSFGFLGTYYVSLGLLGTDAAAGPIAGADDLRSALRQGHELGCHTFSHSDAWSTPASRFEADVVANRTALERIIPDHVFRTLSYPLNPPHPWTKWKVGDRFLCCRGGGQTFNAGTADRGYVRSYFLEKSGGSMTLIKTLISDSLKARGWLIFSTHDVCERPTAFGCTPEFFEEVVSHAARSGADILPVAMAAERVLRTA